MTDTLQIILRDKLLKQQAGDVSRPGSKPSQLPPFADQIRRPARGMLSTSEPVVGISSSTRP